MCSLNILHVVILQQSNAFLLLQGVQLDFILDLHADISHEGVFVRGNSYDDVFRSVVNVLIIIV